MERENYVYIISKEGLSTSVESFVVENEENHRNKSTLHFPPPP